MTLFVTWLWQGHGFERMRHKVPTYYPKHVAALASMLRRHGGHRLVCVTNYDFAIEGVETIPIPSDVLALPSFYPRLWMFSREFGDRMGERFCQIDLDCVILDDLGPVVAHGDFAIANGAHGGTTHYNASLFVMEPGARPQVWNTFSLAAAEAEQAKAEEASLKWFYDQSWIGHVLGEDAPTFGEPEGIQIYRKHRGDHLRPPPGTRVMFFCGPHDPLIEAQKSRWIARAWH